ncbi:BglG family transcription antiterminator [Salipaludibacillus agaradhaerens]|uniref:BglG family transcription antiterminator n=1 Tax=Salipaludibacillus agaradhaerens TaxID=76935 RepID=A0A9Q4G081_SALAG|nr:BglG family transcription antiterminator [Salipaludibacillus agaradhaerens]MCR6098206.1 BglG family transcription antiterminator [Salipaludibacillus agaradhaerens]MCR6116164.1 BglG family transcription antiterminator [Salipaludibacillus agaradhaerens]
MMYVSARDRYILDKLIEQPEGVTIREIASSLQVSERTIHRDLTTFDALLRPYELTLKKKTGKGIYLQGAKEQIKQFAQDLQDSKHVDFMPEQRQVIITCKLLEAFEPTKLQSLASDLNVTVATVSNDLEKVAEWLGKYDLNLKKRRGYGIQVTGLESAKRRAISGILAENFDEADILQYIRRQLPSEGAAVSQSIAGQLLGFINVEKLKQVEEAVERISRSLDYRLADSAYIALVVHLTLAIERILKGENIQMNDELMDRLKEKKEFKLAAEMAQQLEDTFSLKIPDAEVGYITMHLRGAKLRQDTAVLFTEENMDTAMIAKKLTEEVSQQVKIDLQKDLSLYQGLMAHLDPALYRLKQGMHIYNPLQDKIQQNYPELFTIVKEAFQQVLTDLPIPDEEIGFLVLHFGSAIERDNQRRTHEAVVICSSGIGSSKMIASRLQNEFPAITKVKNMSLFDLDDMKPEELDLVISTIPLVDYSVDYVQVNPFLTKEDVLKIQEYIDRQERQKTMPKQTVPSIKKELKSTHEAQSVFMKMQQSLTCTVALLEHFRLIKSTKTGSLWPSLTETMEILKDKGLITHVEAVISKLKERAKMSGLGLPNTTMALYHARSEHVFQPFFLIHELAQPITVDAMDSRTIEMKRVLIMLGPVDMTQEETDILSSISSMIIENDDSLHLFQYGSEEDISHFISHRLMTYYQNYFNEGDS